MISFHRIFYYSSKVRRRTDTEEKTNNDDETMHMEWEKSSRRIILWMTGGSDDKQGGGVWGGGLSKVYSSLNAQLIGLLWLLFSGTIWVCVWNRWLPPLMFNNRLSGFVLLFSSFYKRGIAPASFMESVGDGGGSGGGGFGGGFRLLLTFRSRNRAWIRVRRRARSRAPSASAAVRRSSWTAVGSAKHSPPTAPTQRPPTCPPWPCTRASPATQKEKILRSVANLTFPSTREKNKESEKKKPLKFGSVRCVPGWGRAWRSRQCCDARPVREWRRREQVVTLVETGREAVKVTLFQEPGQELLGNFGVLRLGRVLHGVTKQRVLLAQLYRLLPAVVALFTTLARWEQTRTRDAFFWTSTSTDKWRSSSFSTFRFLFRWVFESCTFQSVHRSRWLLIF